MTNATYAPIRLATAAEARALFLRACRNASTGGRVTAATITVVVGLTLAALPALFGGTSPGALASVAIVGLVYLLATAWMVSKRGCTLGGAICGLRVVDLLTGLPPAPSTVLRRILGTSTRPVLAPAPLPRPQQATNRPVPGAGPLGRLTGTSAINIRGGRDPRTLCLAPLAPTVVGQSPTPRTPHILAGPLAPIPTPWHTVPAQALPHRHFDLDSMGTLHVEDQTFELKPGTNVVGRSPDPQIAADHYIMVPDMARTLSKSHVLIGWDQTGIWVQDLNSTNGTSLLDLTGQMVSLGAGERMQLPVGWRLRVGHRIMSITVAGQAPLSTPPAALERMPNPQAASILGVDHARP